MRTLFDIGNTHPICLRVPLYERAAVKKEKRKRRIRRGIFCIFALLLPLFVLINLLLCDFDTAFAGGNKSEEEIEKELGEAVNDAIDRLDMSELESYLGSLGADERAAIGIGDVKATLKALVSGNTEDFFGKLLALAGGTVGRYFLGFLPSCVTVIVICLLKNMLGGLTGDFMGGSTTEVVHIVCYCAIIVTLMAGIIAVIGTVTSTITSLMTFAAALFPALLTLLSMLGGAASVATYTPLMAALSSVIMKIVTAVIVPAFIATIVFSVVGNITKSVKLDKLTKLIKSASSWLIGIVFGLFATFLTVQGISGGVADKFGFNVAKFALSSYVPILGGYLSDGVDLLSASIVLVKNALGYTAAIILVCTVLFPLVKTVIFTLTIRLTAAIAEPIGDERTASLLNSVAGNMGLLISALAGVGSLFFILLLLLIGTCNVF